MSKSDTHGISKAKIDRPVILIHGFLGTPSVGMHFRLLGKVKRV